MNALARHGQLKIHAQRLMRHLPFFLTLLCFAKSIVLLWKEYASHSELPP